MIGPRRLAWLTNCPETCTGRPTAGRTDWGQFAFPHCIEDIGRWRCRRCLVAIARLVALRRGVGVRERVGQSDACWPGIQIAGCGRNRGAKMCWVKRRRNSLAERVIFRCLLP